MMTDTIRTNAIGNAFENASRIAAEVARNGGPVDLLAQLAVASRGILEDSGRVAEYLDAIDLDLKAVEDNHLFGMSAGDILERVERNRGAAGYLARSVEKLTLDMFIDAENHAESEALSSAVYDLHVKVTRHASDVADTGRRYLAAIDAEQSLSVE